MHSKMCDALHCTFRAWAAKQPTQRQSNFVGNEPINLSPHFDLIDSTKRMTGEFSAIEKTAQYLRSKNDENIPCFRRTAFDFIAIYSS